MLEPWMKGTQQQGKLLQILIN
uniref:Uncharacterized protein n=1 Tax=Anguilla anguilla TaxID=7936 RepID=A0A0E9RG46_ANGAN